MPPMSSFQSNKQNKQHKKQKKSASSAPPRPGGKRKSRASKRGGRNTMSDGNVGRMGQLVQRNHANRRVQLIIEDEFVVDINGSVGFVNTQFQVNPGSATVFPWGSRPAGNYSEYQYEMLEFYYTPEVTGFATQGQTGKVILSFDYDATGTAITTKQQAEAMATQGQSKSALKGGSLPCEYQWMPVDCSQIHKGVSKYVLPGAQPANTDLKTYNAGILNVSTIGQANTTLVGELHVKYRCRLEKPILDPAVVAGGVVHFSGTAPTTADNFATAALQVGGTPSMTGITAAANVITFPAGIPGNYLINMGILVGTSATGWTAANWTPTGATNLTILTNTTRDNAAELPSAAATTGTSLYMTAVYTVPVTGGTITITPSTLVGGAGMDLFIVSLPVTLVMLASPREIRDELQDLRSQIAELRQMRVTSCDSDFEDDCKSSDRRDCSSSSSSAPLSQSTLGLIGELIARKSSSHKKE